jgi:hypothetical protein
MMIFDELIDGLSMKETMVATFAFFSWEVSRKGL